MKQSTPFYLVSDEDMQVLLKKKNLYCKVPIQLDVYTSCLYFIRNRWTNVQYKAWRNGAEDYNVRLVPFQIMMDALDSMMPIPKPVRCQNEDSCKKCGILSVIEVLMFELSLVDVQKKLRFFPKIMIADLVDQLKLNCGRTFVNFNTEWPTLIKRYSEKKTY